MGHLGHLDKGTLLRALRARLAQDPVGMPEAPGIYEILDILFTEEEALVASNFPFWSRFPYGSTPLDVLAELTGLKTDRLEEILEEMMKKGLIVKSERNGQSEYALRESNPGFFGSAFRYKDDTFPKKKLADLMNLYRQGGVFGIEFYHAGGVQRTKALLTESVVPSITTDILTFDQASSHVRDAGRGALAACTCRLIAKVQGTVCDKPIEDVCISLGPAADFLVEQAGVARWADVSEIIDVLHRCEGLGMMHVGDNVQKQMYLICNCCGDCCAFLRGHRYGMQNPYFKRAVNSTGFMAQVNLGKCDGCGRRGPQCAAHCLIGAISVAKEGEKKIPTVDQERCLGCGLCVRFCPVDGAMNLAERPNRVMPPKNMNELSVRLLAQKGRLP